MLTMRPYRDMAVDPPYASHVRAALAKTVATILDIAGKVKLGNINDSFSVENSLLGVNETWAEVVDLDGDASGLVRVMLR